MSVDPTELRAALGEAIKNRRKAHFTQETLADRMDIHLNHVGAIERGERYVSLKTLVRFANALGCKPSTL